MIKLLTFDLDNTLWDVDVVMLRANKATREWLQQRYPAFAASFDFRQLAVFRDQALRENPERHHDLTWLRKELMRLAFLSNGFAGAEAAAAAEESFEVFYRERNRVDFFPDVLEGLTALQKEFAMISISNGNADIAKVGLSAFFPRHFSAISVGASKPDPKIFQAALSAAGVQAHEALHIGDDPEQDVAAAAAVGMKTVWVNYGDRLWPDNLPRADGEIGAFAELPPLVQRLAQM